MHLKYFIPIALLAAVVTGCNETGESDDGPNDSFGPDVDSDSDSDSDSDTDSDADTDTDWDTDSDGDPPTLPEICEQAPVLDPEANMVINSSNLFGIDLFREIAARVEGNNATISPVSLHTVWSMLYNGAANNSAQEIHDTLQMGSLDVDSLNEGYQSVLAALRSQDTDVTLRMANSVWIDDFIEGGVSPTFIDANEDYYQAEVFNVNLQAPGMSDVINQWVSDNTGGHIDDLIGEIGPLVAMYLVNGVYFSSPWTYSFEETDTATASFLTGDGEEKDVEMMYTHACLPYYQNGDIDMVQLPYGNGIYAMSLILPSASSSIDEVVENLNAADWNDWQANTYIAEVDLKVPKFESRFRSAEDLLATVPGDLDGLVGVLKSMGIDDVFSLDEGSPADLSGIAGPPGYLYVSDTRQNTFIQVSEEGTEAAAASMVEVSIVIDGDADGPPQREITFDRPFLFAIHDRCSGSILFMGQITDPPPLTD